MKGVDFLLQDEGTVAAVFPLRLAAADWVAEHLPATAIYWTGVVMEHRFVAPIVLGILDDGLDVAR